MKKLNILFLAFALLFTFSCDEELDLQPAQSLSESEALSDITSQVYKLHFSAPMTDYSR